MSKREQEYIDAYASDIQQQGRKSKRGLGTNFLLFIYIILAIASGAANRVAFRLMQYSTTNYSYFISQLTTFVYLPVNFLVILFKIWCTNDITPKMTRFPKWKFLVMGFFDSFAGVLMVVGGVNVPGIMQNLLLQGSVPVTMLFSILLLRSRGDELCRTARHVLETRNIRFTERYVGAEAVKKAKKENISPCRITVDGVDIGKVNEILRYHSAPDPDVIARVINWCCATTKNKHFLDDDLGVSEYDPLDSEKIGNKFVVLYSDAHSWSRHLTSFYSAAQYIGALVIMGGLVLSVWPALTGGEGAGPFQWDLIFASTTIPIALSGVYKEIAFNDIDLDVWYLNGYVAIFQFILGLAYAPLAAYMTNLPLDQIPLNIWQGLQCFLAGTNFISLEAGYMCSQDKDCGNPGKLQCCDSCDGSVPGVSSLSALAATLIYMGFNIAYNVFLVLVIKHGSAALMYATSAVVLPLGGLAFTLTVFMQDHAQPFTTETGIGLGVVILGLLIYRFVDTIVEQCKSKNRVESHPLS